MATRFQRIPTTVSILPDLNVKLPAMSDVVRLPEFKTAATKAEDTDSQTDRLQTGLCLWTVAILTFALPSRNESVKCTYVYP